MSSNPTTPEKTAAAAALAAPRLKTWAFRLIAVLFGIVMTEGVLSVAGWISPRVKYQLDPPWRRSLEPDATLGYRMSPHFPGNDRLGFRNVEVPDRCEVLVVGASLTYGFAATREQSWPSHLARVTGKTVYNMSCGGYGPCEFDVLMERGMKFEPHTVLVEIYPSNDMADAYGSAYSDGRFDELQSSDPALLASLREADAARPIGTLMAKWGGRNKSSQRSLGLWIAENSSLYGLARAVRQTIGGNQYKSFLRDDASENDVFREATQRPGRVPFEGDAGTRTVFLPPAHLMTSCDLSDPRIKEGQRIMEGRILSMQARARAQGARFVIVLLPSKAVVYAPTVRKQDATISDAFFRLVDLDEEDVRGVESFLREHQIEFVDVTSALQVALEQSKRIYPESDDEHLNGDGYGVLAEAVAAGLDSNVDRTGAVD
jgi:hypothetical protein